MKTESQPKPAPDADAPNIAVVAPPTDAEQLAAAKTEIAQLLAERGKNAETHAALIEKLAKLERGPFAYALSNIDSGTALDEAGEQLRVLCAAVKRRQEKGTLTLRILVKPFKAALVMSAEVKIAEPKADLPVSIFYASEEGDLSRNDPTQREFGFASRGDRSDEVDAGGYLDERATR